MSKGLTTRSEDYSRWYGEVIEAADLAEHSVVRGCMVIKPWGYALWENMQRALDRMFKATGHRNAYFPLFIPKSFLEKEAEHVEGFAKECAVVTHHRLVAGPDGGLIADPDALLEEPLVVRPTSETIIGASFAQWVNSYRDLPLLINQWANVVRWELRTRLFLRTTEFLWQEGHTAHATEQEALEETSRMLDVYATFAEEFMAMPVIKGRKTEGERFPGAVDTLTIEAMMQDLKALQAGTSHFLGQNFAKASGIKYQDADGKEQHAWTTSWGVSTRLIGALIMTHSDDLGLVLPPQLAPAHVVLLPIHRDDESRDRVVPVVEKIADRLRQQRFGDREVEVEVDGRDLRGKNWVWIKRGIPLRVEIGPRDLDANQVTFYRRDEGPKERHSVDIDAFCELVPSILEEMQANLFQKARKFRKDNTRRLESWDEIQEFFGGGETGQGGFAHVRCSGSAAADEKLAELKLSVRCIPLDGEPDEGPCAVTGEPAQERMVIAKAY